MVVMDDTKRSGIAMELADMKALQELLIATEQKLLPAVSGDKEISDRLSDFLKDDQEDLTVIEGVIAKFGGGSPQPRDTLYLAPGNLNVNSLTKCQFSQAFNIL